MTMLDVSYPEWMDRAACATSDANFFPGSGQTTDDAKEVCRECPVRVACLAWALETGIGHGVYGGVTPRDRRRIKSASSMWECSECLTSFRNQKGLTLHRRDYCGVPRTHGTHGAYGSGCRCAPCRSAHAAYMRNKRRAAMK